MKKIILATNNPGKIAEIAALLAPIECIPQQDFNIPPAQETGKTFIENAIIKARQVSTIAMLPALADDSGLVIPELNDEPGIFSARFAGKNASDLDNLNLVLNKIKQKNLKSPKAYFYCAIALFMNGNSPTPIISTAKLEGKIISSPRGTNGFGYDPIFYIDAFGCTLAELNQADKNRISHRFLALNKLGVP